MAVAINEKTIEITVNGKEVEYLFDRDRAETFDPTAAVSYMPYGDGIYILQDWHQVVVKFGEEYDEDEWGEEVEDYE